MATLYITDGQVLTVRPEQGEYFTLSELQTYVGGDLEWITFFSTHETMIFCENAKMKGWPMNRKATRVASDRGFLRPIGEQYDYIAGPAILVHESEMDGGEDADEDDEEDGE